MTFRIIAHHKNKLYKMAYSIIRKLRFNYLTLGTGENSNGTESEDLKFLTVTQNSNKDETLILIIPEVFEYFPFPEPNILAVISCDNK